MRRNRERWYRHPRTTAERRANQDGWCRARRNSNNLPNTWDDRPTTITKSWKDRRKKQYYIGGRGKRHEIFLDSKYYEWNLENYFKDHNIPYKIEEIKRGYTKIWYQTEESIFLTYKERKYKYTKRNGKVIEYFYTVPVYETVKLDPPIPHIRHYSKVVGYKVTWWSNKDIGIDRIIGKIRIME